MAGKKAHPCHREWYWEHNDPLGIWRSMDWPAIRRGRQVYTEVFAPCHPLTKLTFNHFQQFMTKEEIKALASQYEIVDAMPDPSGQLVTRPGKSTDWLPAPYPNSQAAAFANGGAEPPDLRTIIFGREGEANFVFSLLTGYTWGGDLFPVPPFAPQMKPGQFWNPYFKGCVLSMPPPLSDGMLEYEDGTPATICQMSKDIVSFLRWTAEPEYDDRRIGYWKGMATWTLMFLAGIHICQKQASWRIYQRITYRYWKKTW